MSNSTFSIARDPNGVDVLVRRPLRPPTSADGNAGVTVGPIPTGYALIADRATNYGYLQRLEAVCLATGIAGNFQLQGVTGLGPTGPNLRTLAIPKTPVVGDRYVWEFPTPLTTTDRGGQFILQPIPSGMGTWFFIAEGFYSSAQQE